jgi:hypothetical protein
MQITSNSHTQYSNSFTIGLRLRLAGLLRPWEMGDWDDEEGVTVKRLTDGSLNQRVENPYDESAIPARALYQAKNAANKPKYPPAF